MKDVVIVGGGLAGLSAGWRLRHWDTVLLESGGRVGGRIRSERRGRDWLNWGGHVFAGPGSSTDALLTEAGVTAAQVPGSPAGLAMNGKLLIKGPVQAYPFRIPMSASSRIALLKAGVKVGAQVLRYANIVRQRPGEDPTVRQLGEADLVDDGERHRVDRGRVNGGGEGAVHLGHRPGLTGCGRQADLHPVGGGLHAARRGQHRVDVGRVGGVHAAAGT